jgi:hypothetical protein
MRISGKIRLYQIVFFAILTVIPFLTQSQELEGRVQVNYSQIQGSNKEIFEEMQKALFEFVSNRNWTNNVFKAEERIECNFLLTISKQLAVDEFQGTLQVISNRSVYNSGYDSPMLNILDKNIQFRYAEGQTLEFNESTHEELTALFAYYVYIILGFDYDSFGSMGGTPFFEKAQKIVNNAQSSKYGGWKAFESRKNRYWLAENLMNSVYNPIREFSYTYHRMGLDNMSQKPAEGRSNIADGLKELLKVHQQKPNSYLMNIFFETKSDEIVSILSESDQGEIMRAYNVLKEIDKGNLTKYDKLTKKGG